MKELLIATPSTQKRGTAKRFVLGKSLKGWKTVTTPWKEFHTRGSLPDVTMVQVGATATGATLKNFIKELAAKQEGTRTPSFIVLCFGGSKRPSSSKVAEILRSFHRQEQVEVRWNSKPSNIGNVLVEIEPKLEVLREVEAAKSGLLPPRPSPLDQLEKVLAATRDLRVGNGNLSAQRIADVCGTSLSELATWLGRSRQAVSKTPDADALQPTLAFFERVARIRLRLSDNDFRKWLRVPNELLEGKRPIELLANGQGQVLADFVDDMLTGSPT